MFSLPGVSSRSSANTAPQAGHLAKTKPSKSLIYDHCTPKLVYHFIEGNHIAQGDIDNNFGYLEVKWSTLHNHQMKPRITEQELDRAFADHLVQSKEFCIWVLEQTKFANLAQDAILLYKEQADEKPRKRPENWWRHWWCRLDDRSESETDIFAVFGFYDTDNRIALHIEDKPPHGKFTPNQWVNYSRRGQFMLGKEQYMNYSEFTTILLAPNRFLHANSDKVHYFECLISYESVSAFIPEFAKSLNDASN